MSLNVITKTITLADGREITIETGKLAKQADGSVVVRCGGTMLLATVVSAKEAREGVDFMPLSVDYQEKFASAGKIPGGFLKRESRLSDYEILICRLVDRALRPLFPSDYHSDTQVMISLISLDKEVLPDCMAALAASAALSVSDIPIEAPISEVRVGRVDGQFVVNPTRTQMESADMDMIIAATEENIMMVEGEMLEASEADMLEAIKVAHEEIKKQCAAQKELTIETGKTEKRTYDHETNDPELKADIAAKLYDGAYAVAAEQNADKKLRSQKFKAVVQEYIDALPEDSEVNIGLVKKYYHDVEKDAVRNFVLDKNSRLDGRALNEIRPIWSEVDYLPSAHGSAVFTRGETQSLTSVTLGTKLDQQMVDGAVHSGTNKFMLHYNFPAFSTGEARPNRGPGRREVGHGNLAYRALKNMLPKDEDNAYTIRVVSDILESNGSSSMATVCAGTMALMDAGVPVKSAVSGIAMGLISDGTRVAVLSDILGDEDHLGDMDFKVTGTKDGITACQMDIKVDGLSYEILSQALEQAKEGRLHIMGEMAKTITETRSDLKPHAPRFHKQVIDKEMIGPLIGPGGKIIQEIQAESETTITIEEKDGKGHVTIFGDSKEAIDKAKGRVNAIVAQPEVGEVYEGKIKSIMPYGAFVEFIPGKDGLLHISEIRHERVDNTADVLTEGEVVKVKLIGIDPKSGKFKLSRKALLPKPEEAQKSEA